jgi:hypothetical protein
LKPDETAAYLAIRNAEVRRKLDEVVDYGKNPRFSKALDEICENPVGKTMFKVLIIKMQAEKKTMRIWQHAGNGSYYEEYVVYVNLSFYEENGAGISSRRYFYLDKRGKIGTKLKSLAASIFHEFCHGLHDISETYTDDRKNVLCLERSLFGKIWGDDEELRTITCFNDDPICDHCFDLCRSIRENEQFRPRYSHGGYVGETEPSELCLKEWYECIPDSQKFMDGWKEYVI